MIVGCIVPRPYDCGIISDQPKSFCDTEACPKHLQIYPYHWTTHSIRNLWARASSWWWVNLKNKYVSGTCALKKPVLIEKIATSEVSPDLDGYCFIYRTRQRRGTWGFSTREGPTAHTSIKSKPRWFEKIERISRIRYMCIDHPHFRDVYSWRGKIRAPVDWRLGAFSNTFQIIRDAVSSWRSRRFDWSAKAQECRKYEVHLWSRERIPKARDALSR